MAYIANRPVRFDRDYAVGEIIPDGVIDPKMTTKLVGMGRIIRIPDIPKSAPQPTDAPDSGGSHSDDEITAERQEAASEGESEASERTEIYRCEECGREFASERALAAHSRIHKSR